MLKKVLLVSAVVTVSCVSGYVMCMKDVVKKHSDILPDNKLTLKIFKDTVEVSVYKKSKS